MSRLGGRGSFLVSDRLRPEQKAAVLAVLDSRDLAINLRGAAGTGKTATLQELRRALDEARRNVIAIAPTASAVEELQKVGFKDAVTIARLLADAKQRSELAGHIVIVDEAGMVASKDMAELIDLAKAKVLALSIAAIPRRSKVYPRETHYEFWNANQTSAVCRSCRFSAR